MANLFNSIFVNKPKYNKFNLSHEVKLTCDFGELIPFYVEPTLPGDKFNISVEHLARMAALINPVMHRINIFTYFVFVPMRLEWEDWKEFITGGEDGSAMPVYPRYRLTVEQANTYLRPGKLADYLGFPVLDYDKNYSNSQIIDAMPFRIYRRAYNDLFRDQNLEPELDSDGVESGIIDLSDVMAEQLLSVHRKAWHKDYFTSALPWPQRGEPVKIPVAGEVDFNSPDLLVYRDNYMPIEPGSNVTTNPNIPGTILGSTLSADDADGQLKINTQNWSGEINNISTTLNDLRTATKLQQWLERNALGGARYIEQIMAHFGVKSSDARLQRTEYLGGTKSPIVISEVLQTSSTDETSPQGHQAGRAIGLGKSRFIKKYCEEHGYIMGFLSVVPKSGYMQGLPRKFTKFDKFDYYFPEFANLGEQAIKNQELFYTQQAGVNTGVNDQTFGYAPRYAEYRFNLDRVCGDFRSSLMSFHLARHFENLPKLNKEFVQVRAYESDLNRIFAVEDQERYNVDPIWLQLLVNCRAKRLMPKFATPRL